MSRQRRTPSEIVTSSRRLQRLVHKLLGVRVPARAMCPHHHAPLDYLVGSFVDQRDLLVWANRGGGKTMLAAIATLLDAIYRAPVSICVLGGSFDQSDRLADYIRTMLRDRPGLGEAKIGREKVHLANGSEIRILAQSQRAVRGQHVQKVRCDEVDLFDEGVWRAVQFATRSEADTKGSIEVLSTLHRAGGLMDQLVSQAPRYVPSLSADGSAEGVDGFAMVNWCLWEVIERCGPQRECEHCPLAEDCGGIARRAEGFFSIDDAIAIKARSSRSAWNSEMLCRGAVRDWLVFDEFSRSRHVDEVLYRPGWPTFRAIDFGYRSPLVCLWVQLAPEGRVHVIDEYVRARRPLTQHAAAILARDRGPVQMTYVDPAGRQRESTSGSACTEILAAAGIPCAWRGSTIAEGLELLRGALDPAVGEPTLAIHPRCTKLIESFETYHYPAPGAGNPNVPVKDGPDHAIDALRYFFVNRCRPRHQTHRVKY
ncbi:MAG: hypothetical protein ACOCZU_05755 [Planctomycetota bacterium]